MKPEKEEPKKNKLSSFIEEWQNTILITVMAFTLFIGHSAINGHWFMEDLFHPVIKVSQAGESGEYHYTLRTDKEVPDSTCIYLIEVEFRGHYESEYVTLEEIHPMKCKLIKKIDNEITSWQKAKELSNLKCN